jgi:hypothetical protein
MADAGPSATLNELLEALARPLLAAVSTKVPDAEKTRFPKDATPATADAVSVPPTPAGDDEIVTEAVDPVQRLPQVSSICTTGAGLMGCPTVALGAPATFTEKVSCVGVPGPMLIEPLVAVASPGDVALSAYVPAAVKSKALNVAIPATALAVTVPKTPVGDDEIVIAAVDPVTGLPLASSTVTETEVSEVPAVPLDGPTVNASIAAGPVAIATDVLVAFESPVDVAVSV